MKYIDWNHDKNTILKQTRDISFEEVLNAISDGKVLDIMQHHNIAKYSNQYVLVIAIRDYVYCVPYVEDDDKYFLKTIYPSRVLTKRYLSKGEKL
jgi:hypothetical protein